MISKQFNSNLMPVLFYASNCGHCKTTIPAVIEQFTSRRIPVVVRKPSVKEWKSLPGTPALYIPAKCLDLDHPLLLIGSNISTWVDQVLNNG